MSLIVPSFGVNVYVAKVVGMRMFCTSGDHEGRTLAYDL
jgi:hypothetical protein